MLPYNIFTINFYIFAVSVTILITSLTNNKIIVSSYQVNSHHNIKDDSTRSSSAESLSSSAIVFHDQNINQHHKLNHHLRLDNSHKFNSEHNKQNKEQIQKFHQKQKSHHHHYLSENRKRNLESNKNYLHYIPTLSTSSSSSSSFEQQNKEESSIGLDLENNEYPREIYSPSSSSSLTTSNNYHRKLDEATHPFSLTTPTHIAILNHKTPTSEKHYKNLKKQQIQYPSGVVRKKSFTTPRSSTTTTTTGTNTIKLQNELHQHKSLNHHRHPNINSTTNNQKINNLNERKLHGTLSSQSHNMAMTPPQATAAAPTLTLSGKEYKMSQQHQKHHSVPTIMGVNASKSKYHHHNIETTPKHSLESSDGRHHHNDYQRIVNKNINKNHRHYNSDDDDDNDDDDHDDDDNENNESIDNDENDNDDDDDDYYYYNENRNDDIDKNDENNLEFEVKGDKKNNKNFHNKNKRIILNRGDRNHNINNNNDNDDDELEHNHDDIDLIKNDLINHEIFNHFDKDFDLYDYIDDEPKDENSTTSEKSESLTEEKWKKYGTPQQVANSRREYYSQVQKVNAHIMRVGYEAECKIPKPKIIQISEPSKRYVPHCTVLHRCSDDTGCCQSDFRTCVMKKYQTVDLYFYVVPLGMKTPIVETLSFENHTECHCIERERSRPPSQYNRNDTENIQQEQQQQQQPNINSNLLCQCAKHFTMFEEKNNYEFTDYNDSGYKNTKRECRCDCVSNDNVCQRFKQGEEGFGVDDRKCITENRCTIPTCEFGDYSIQSGRCPKTKQKRNIRPWHFD